MINNKFDDVWKEALEEKMIPDEKIAIHIEERSEVLQMLKKCIKKLNVEKPNILEVGCGSAIISYALAQSEDANFWAVDISANAIKYAEKIGDHFSSKITLDVADATKTDFQSGFFDLIFSQGVIEHFRDPELIMKEQTRILAPDGILIVDVPQKFNFYTVYKTIVSICNRWPYGWERSYSIFELKELGRRSGLKIIDSTGRCAEFELSKSKVAPVALMGNLYNYFMKNIYRIFKRFAIYYLQDICVAYKKAEEGV